MQFQVSGEARQLVVVNRPIGALTLDPDNARVHRPAQIRQIAESIRAFQFNAPVLVDRNLKVLAGHGRLLACRHLGMAEIPTISLEHLTEAQARAYAIADNRLSETAEWSERQLALHLKALAELDLDFSLEATGFTMGEIDLKIEGLGDLRPDDLDPDDAPPPSGPAVCKTGDAFMLGDHRILCASALEARSYPPLMQGEIAGAVFVDPPYGGSIKSYLGHKRKSRHREFVQGSTNMTAPELAAFLTQSGQLVAEHSADGSVAFWCMDWRHLEIMLAAGNLTYDEMLNICVWTKPQGGMGSLYRSAHEFVLVFRKGSAAHRNNVQLGRYGRNRTNVWSYPGANSFLRGSEEADLLACHPTPKPVALVSDALLDVSARRDLVLDVFLGSGTTLIACERIGRRCRGMELDPLYVDLAIRRWQRLTGQAAVHQASGRPFDDLAAEADP